MANAVLERAVGGAPEDPQRPGWAAGGTAGVGAPPGVVTGDTMSMGGVVSATAVLFVLLLGAGVFGWSQVDTAADGTSRAPAWILPAVLGGFVVVLVASFKPALARVLAPVYALVQGAVLGAISRVFENEWDGIVVQAVMATAVVFGTMLFLYGTRIIRVTERMRRVVIGATAALAIFYLLSILLSLFGAQMPLVWDAGPFGILFSVAVVGLAAFNLVVDFDLVERGVAQGLPRAGEWFCALALMVSIVWLYLEILRLLAKLRQN